jgi:hypothetical protein
VIDFKLGSSGIFIAHWKWKFAQRIDRAQYALACDDEANAHYGIEPCRWYRFKLAVKAFVTGK